MQTFFKVSWQKKFKCSMLFFHNYLTFETFDSKALSWGSHVAWKSCSRTLMVCYQSDRISQKKYFQRLTTQIGQPIQTICQQFFALSSQICPQQATVGINFLQYLANSLITGKSFSEALILASTNPQYDKRLFMELQLQ